MELEWAGSGGPERPVPGRPGRAARRAAVVQPLPLPTTTTIPTRLATLRDSLATTGPRVGPSRCPRARSTSTQGRRHGSPPVSRSQAARAATGPLMRTFPGKLRTAPVSPSSETQTWKRLRSGSNGWSGGIQARRTSTKRSPRGRRASAPSSGGRPPTAGCRPGRARRRTRRSARSVLGWGRAASGFERRRGQSSRVPSMAIVSSSPVMFLRTALRVPQGHEYRRVFRSLKHHGGWGPGPP